MGNAVVHFEIGAADDGPLVAFYGELFGWELQGFPGGGYTMIDTRGGGGINGGIGRSQTGEPWSAFYVETDDLQATLDKATSLGGTTVMPVTDLGGTAIAMFSDPDGLLVGLVQAPAEPSPGDEAGPSAGSGEPADWFEVLGSDPARTQHFYTELFDWTVETAGLPGYATVDTGTGRGIYGGLGGGVAARWATVYVGVADVDEVLRRAEKLGGSRISESGVPELKNAARTALYGSADDMRTGAFRDPAGNVVGVYHKDAD
jgi:predicted enzyme related to lactoylglutathione lyase